MVKQRWQPLCASLPNKSRWPAMKSIQGAINVIVSYDMYEIDNNAALL